MNQPDNQAQHTPFGFAATGCYKQFVSRHGGPESILVTTTLRSGRQFVSLGLWMQLVAEVPGCVMIQGGDSSYEAIVVREEDVASVEFRVIEEPEDDGPTPFGFYPQKN